MSVRTLTLFVSFRWFLARIPLVVAILVAGCNSSSPKNLHRLFTGLPTKRHRNPGHPYDGYADARLKSRRWRHVVSHRLRRVERPEHLRGHSQIKSIQSVPLIIRRNLLRTP
jgi:hypothetical protein